MGTIAKALQLLSYFSSNAPEIGLSQFVQLTGEDKATLQALADRGIAWGICTNKPRAYTEPLLERLGIEPAPGSVVSEDCAVCRGGACFGTGISRNWPSRIAKSEPKPFHSASALTGTL